MPDAPDKKLHPLVTKPPLRRLEHFEGNRPDVYKPKPESNPTVGRGVETNNPKFHEKYKQHGVTPKQMETVGFVPPKKLPPELLGMYWDKEVVQDMPKVTPGFSRLPVHAQMALMDLRFNAGASGYRKFKKMHNNLNAYLATADPARFQKVIDEMKDSKYYREQPRVTQRATRNVQLMQQAMKQILNNMKQKEQAGPAEAASMDKQAKLPGESFPGASDGTLPKADPQKPLKYEGPAGRIPYRPSLRQVKNTERPLPHYKSVYGDKLQENLNQAQEAVKKYNIPVNQAAAIKANKPFIRGYRDGSAFFRYRPRREFEGGKIREEERELNAPVGDDFARDVYETPTRKEDIAAMGLNPTGKLTPSEGKGAEQSMINHEMAHAMTVPDRRENIIEYFDRYKKLAPRMSQYRDDRIAIMRRIYDLNKEGEKGKEKEKEIRSLQKRLRALVSQHGPSTYVGDDDAEMFPPMSALQQHMFKTTGKRITTPEQYDAVVKPYTGLTDAALEKKMEADKLPIEVRRLLRYRQQMSKSQNPHMLWEYDNINRQWIPGIVQQHRPRTAFKRASAELMKESKITIDLDVGDEILVGRFKNKKVKVKEIGEDEHGHPMVNGRKLLTVRLAKLMKEASALGQLRKAKAHSDKRQYDAKAIVLGRLIKQRPTEFVIDSTDGDIVGITHKPTNFRIHLPMSKLPVNLKTAALPVEDAEPVRTIKVPSATVETPVASVETPAAGTPAQNAIGLADLSNRTWVSDDDWHATQYQKGVREELNAVRTYIAWRTRLTNQLKSTADPVERKKLQATLTNVGKEEAAVRKQLAQRWRAVYDAKKRDAVKAIDELAPGDADFRRRRVTRQHSERVKELPARQNSMLKTYEDAVNNRYGIKGRTAQLDAYYKKFGDAYENRQMSTRTNPFRGFPDDVDAQDTLRDSIKRYEDHRKTMSPGKSLLKMKDWEQPHIRNLIDEGIIEARAGNSATKTAAEERIDKGVAKGQKIETEPTDAQKDSENYKKGHVDVGGLKISIENPVGSYRSGTDSNGKQWKQKIHFDYGYIKGSKGFDKDHLDVFIHPEADVDKPVFVVNQTWNGKFDEHKCMIGFDNKTEARKAYLKNYEDGWKGCGSIVQMTFDKFKTWATGTGPSKGALRQNKEMRSKTAALSGDCLKNVAEASNYVNKPVYHQGDDGMIKHAEAKGIDPAWFTTPAGAVAGTMLAHALSKDPKWHTYLTGAGLGAGAGYGASKIPWRRMADWFNKGTPEEKKKPGEAELPDSVGAEIMKTYKKVPDDRKQEYMSAVNRMRNLDHAYNWLVNSSNFKNEGLENTIDLPGYTKALNNAMNESDDLDISKFTADWLKKRHVISDISKVPAKRFVEDAKWLYDPEQVKKNLGGASRMVAKFEVENAMRNAENTRGGVRAYLNAYNQIVKGGPKGRGRTAEERAATAELADVMRDLVANKPGSQEAYEEWKRRNPSPGLDPQAIAKAKKPTSPSDREVAPVFPVQLKF